MEALNGPMQIFMQTDVEGVNITRLIASMDPFLCANRRYTSQGMSSLRKGKDRVKCRLWTTLRGYFQWAMVHLLSHLRKLAWKRQSRTMHMWRNFHVFWYFGSNVKVEIYRST